MKLLSAFPLLLSAGIAISQVSAAPLRIVVVSGHISSSSGFVRVGNNAVADPHSKVATMHATTGMVMRPKPGCAGSLRHKAAKLSNWFRITFGMPVPAPSEIKAHGAGPHRVVHLKPSHMHLRPHHAHTHHHHHSAQNLTFIQRLTHALMMLGPWEGRAVSFIIGCGIGVLIRMFWVLAVLAIRSIRGKKQQRDEFVEDEILFEEDQHLLAPPQYVDEYVVTVEEKEGPRDA